MSAQRLSQLQAEYAALKRENAALTERLRQAEAAKGTSSSSRPVSDAVVASLQEDLRNNSAWNHRWFVVTREATPAPPAAAARELDFAFAAIARAPNNESPWNYVRAYLRAAAYADADALLVGIGQTRARQLWIVRTRRRAGRCATWREPRGTSRPTAAGLRRTPSAS